jgi:hypothetical protein
MKQVYQTIAATDLSATAAATETISAPFAGVLRIDECFMRAGEIVSTASSTSATVYITVGGTTVATATPSATTLAAIGDTQGLTASSDKYIEFDAGDDIVVGHDVKAEGTTVTGTTYWHLSMEWGL